MTARLSRWRTCAIWGEEGGATFQAGRGGGEREARGDPLPGCGWVGGERGGGEYFVVDEEGALRLELEEAEKDERE